MAIVVAFVAGTLVSGGIALADGDAITKLTKECSKDPKSDDKIKAHCELLNLVVGLQGQIDILEVPPAEVIVNIDGINVPPTPITINAPQGEKGEQGDPGTNGINGAKGDKGDKGDTGTAGSQTLVVQRIVDTKTVQPGFVVRATPTCPANTQLSGGGFNLRDSSGVDSRTLAIEFAVPVSNQYQVQVRNVDAIAHTFDGYALCVSLTP